MSFNYVLCISLLVINIYNRNSWKNTPKKGVDSLLIILEVRSLQETTEGPRIFIHFYAFQYKLEYSINLDECTEDKLVT